MNALTTQVSSVACSLLALASPGPARSAGQGHALAGRWDGAIEVPGTRLAVALDIAQDAAGGWSGTIDIPQQSARGLELADFEVEAARVRFAIQGVPGDPSFDGELDEGGERIVGEFTQGALVFPFELDRAAAGPTLDQVRARLTGLDEFMASELALRETPGAAVAVIWKGELLLAEGFGLRNLEQELPVTADTLFAIGSSSKAFTCALLADLAEEELVEWDQPVRRYLPEFELADEYSTLHLTPRDLVTHRSGLPRHDLAWYGADATRAELLERLRHLEPSAEPRTEFQYQNLMYMTAGYLAGRVAGSTWEEALRARLLGPLGMERSTLSVDSMQQDPDHALPYGGDDGAVERIPYRNIDAVGPAGSINSSVCEMGRWLAFLLGGGRNESGEQLLEPASLGALFEPVILGSTGAPSFDEEGTAMYALGWVSQSYRDLERLHHGGAIDGFRALVTLFPDAQVGIVVLSNRGGSTVSTVATLWIADRLFELKPIDWSARISALLGAREASVEAAEAEALKDRREGTSPSHELGDYAGVYGDPGYGELRVTFEESGLVAALNGIRSPLEPWHYDVFRVSEGIAEGLLVQFHMDPKGELVALTVELEPRVAPIRFERAPEDDAD